MANVRRGVSLSILGECALHGLIQEKWKIFPGILKELGVDILCVEDELAMHHFVLDHQNQPKELHKNLNSENRTLVRLEPRCVNPIQYRPSIEKLYKNIIVVSSLQRSQDDQIHWKSGYLPNSRDLMKKIDGCRNITKKPGICFVNQNKFSLIKGELYSLRRKAISEFVTRGITFNLAGADWDKSKIWIFKSKIKSLQNSLVDYRFSTLKGFWANIDIKNPKLIYHGRVLDSVDFMANYEFALIIENEASYVSEKLLNAIIAGCIPIYCGPKLNLFGFPNGIAIETGADVNAMISSFQLLDQSEKENILSIGSKWVNSVEVQERWGVESSYFRLAKLMLEIIES